MANANRYHWVAAEVVETPSVLNTVKSIEKDDIMVGGPSDWLIFPVGKEEKIRNYF